MNDIKNVNEPLQLAKELIYKERFSEALTCIRKILDADPKDQSALYMRAVAQRYSGQFLDAAKTLDKLKSVSPEFGRAYQEEGHLHRGKGDFDKALSSYQKACIFNPVLTASWLAQAELLHSQGRSQEANAAMAQANRLKSLPQELVAVTNFIYEGQLIKAEKICKQFLLKNPKNIEGIRLLADIASRLSVVDDAELLLSSAHTLAPDNVQVTLDYINLLRKRQKYSISLDLSKALLETEPENLVFKSQYAVDCLQNNAFEQAIELFDEVLEKLPNDFATLTSKGHALKTFGRHEDAVKCYQTACAMAPNHGDAFYSLANLKTYQFSDQELLAMEEQVTQKDLSYHDRFYLYFALGKAYEDIGKYEKSFGFYEQGNELKRIQSRYKAERMTEELQAQIEVCVPELFKKKSGAGVKAGDPIFILGLPRAGSTLLEQILASHSQVDGTLELPNILALSHRLREGKKISSKESYPHNLDALSVEQLTEFGNKYLDETKIHRQGAPFFIDKMPNNFRHIGLIHLILPNAKIIDARRHPMACCFSGFKQLFAEGQEFTYGLTEIGTYYHDYVNVMAHWDKVLPGKVLRVQYEDVVTDTETQVKRLLDYLDLPFEEACLNFHENRRSVRTASSEQVRQPIYKTGLDQWEHFDVWLEPLKNALGSALTDY